MKIPDKCQTGMPSTRRISKLTGLGIIKNFTVSLDYEKLGLPVMAFIRYFYLYDKFIHNKSSNKQYKSH